MERTVAYRLWQAPFAEQKFAPIVASGALRTARRVLDVGCGPGTNAHHFANADYLGIDINPAYIDDARRRHKREFVVGDVTTFVAKPGEQFDFILLNSLLHHIATPDVTRLLRHLSTLLTPDGHVHILDLVLHGGGSISRSLAEWDRGDYPRPLEEWRAIFADAFTPVVFEPYSLGAFGVTLWNMVYFKGRAS
jgi:SAM-dependent methyltransferase